MFKIRYVLFIDAWVNPEVVLQCPGLGDALRVWGTGESPIASMVRSAAGFKTKMVGVGIDNPGMGADVSASPTLASESEANAPAAATFCHLVDWFIRAVAFFHADRRTGCS
jgi:hypothetical protein